jgi:hypothetical protein
MSGADLEYMRMLAIANISIANAQGLDAARLEQILDNLSIVGGGETNGRGILSIERTDGDGTPGSTDTYTINMATHYW